MNRAILIALSLFLAACSQASPPTVVRKSKVSAKPATTEQPKTPPATQAVAPAPDVAAQPAPLQNPAPSIPPFEPNAVVERVVDGDTVHLADGTNVRYIGIDTPERDEPGYEEARSANAALVEGKSVYLESDVNGEDSYHRRLAYVYVLDSKGQRIFVNAELVRSGVAEIYTFPPNVKHAETLLMCQRAAREAGAGFWPDRVADEEYYVSTADSETFHRPSCKNAKRIREENRQRFDSLDAAYDSGKSRCRACKP